jgi:predicted acylesterase/phospholipase RssA
MSPRQRTSPRRRTSPRWRTSPRRRTSEEAMDRDLGITFAGGGNRCFYQLGLVRAWPRDLWDRVAGVAAVSAGACTAVSYLSGRADEAYEFWCARRAGVTRNLEWSKLLHGERPAPHFEIYRDTLLHMLAEGGLERIRALPFPVLILAARLPPLVPSSLGVLLGLGAYFLEKRVRPDMVHPAWGRVLGFAPVVIDARDCTDPATLATAILASSATPPFTPVVSWQGTPLLDGGLIDNVPAFLADGLPGVRRNLVLLSRPYPPGATGRHGSRLYVAPTREVPIERWDYTRPELVGETMRMGEAEAEVHAPLLAAFLTVATRPSTP